MLSHLIVDNFAIIDHLEIPFRDGFTILTGETGAGKSILVDALNLILGGRASTDVIRADCDEARVQAEFVLNESHLESVNSILEARGLRTSENNLIIRRILRRNNRNKVFINDTLSTVTTLRDVTAGLVDISGQHEHYSLLDPNKTVDVLDKFGELDGLRSEFERSYEKLCNLVDQLQQLRQKERDRINRIDFLEFQLEEIEQADLEPGEQQKLEEEFDKLRNAEKINESLGSALSKAYEQNDSAFELLDASIRSVEKVKKWLPDIEETHSLLQSAKIDVEEAAFNLRQLFDSVQSDPHRLDEVVSRLEEIKRLKKKFGPGDIEAILNKRDELREELETLRNAEKREEKLRQKIKEIGKDTLTKAHELSKKRRSIAPRLTARIKSELADLAMEQTTLEIDFEPADLPALSVLLEHPPEKLLSPHEGELDIHLHAKGLDRAQFLIAPNPGHPPKPLSDIASGGELSRIMLAIKTTIIEDDDVESYVFDEVDTGIGGTTANAVGDKIRKTSRSHQVICISHLPQIASKSEHHFVVEKTVENGETETTIDKLDEAQRVEELARMLGGENTAPKTKDAAREMLQT